MSQITFENLSAQIAAGTITAAEIVAHDCESLNSVERQALLNSLAEKLIRDATPASLASVQSGISVGGAAETIVVPAFLSGRIQIVDTDASATPGLDGTHQFVTDSNGDAYPEGSTMIWDAVPGKYFSSRTLTVLAGMTVLYTFVLKD